MKKMNPRTSRANRIAEARDVEIFTLVRPFEFLFWSTRSTDCHRRAARFSHPSEPYCCFASEMSPSTKGPVHASPVYVPTISFALAAAEPLIVTAQFGRPTMLPLGISTVQVRLDPERVPEIVPRYWVLRGGGSTPRNEPENELPLWDSVQVIVVGPVSSEAGPIQVPVRSNAGGLAKRPVSWIGWKAAPCGLTYTFTSPVSVSVTVMITFTFVSPPAKTQKFPLRARPSTTLTTISTLLDEKNQKYPVSDVSATA